MFDNTVTIYPNLMNKKDIIGTKNQILVDKIAVGPTDIPNYHRHELFSIELILSGECIQYVNGVKYKCKKGSVCLMSPFDVHRFYAEEGMEQYILYFADNIVLPEMEIYLNISSMPFIVNLNEKDTNTMVSDFEELITTNTLDKPHSYIFAKIMVNKILNKIICNTSNLPDMPRDNAGILTKIMAYIRYNFKEHLTVSDIANEFGMSADYISRYFKKHTNQTLKDYILSMRLEYAIRLLKTSSLDISQISYESGFSSPSYFSKLFLEYTGKRPLEFKSELDIQL